MNAICKTCGGIVSWHGTRGSKLSDLKCPKCKTRTLRKVTWEETRNAEKDGRPFIGWAL